MCGDPISTRVGGILVVFLRFSGGREEFEMKWRLLELARMASQKLGSNRDSFNMYC